MDGLSFKKTNLRFVAAIHIRLCVIRSWKKNVGNAATKVRKMCAIQNDYSTTTAERYVRESEWNARYWKQILISFSCCYWFPFHLKLNQSDIRPTHTLHRTIFIELYSTWYTMIYCSQLYFWHFVSPFTLLLRSFLFNMYPVLDPNSINIRWQVWKLSAVINDCKKYHKCSFASFLTPMTPLWESNYLMNKIYMKTPNVLHGL